MERSKIITAIIIIISILVGGLLGFFFYINRKSDTTGIGNAQPRTNIFGSVQGRRVRGVASSTQENQTPLITAEPQENASDIPVLRILYPNPSAGFDFVTKGIYSSSTEEKNVLKVAKGTTTATSSIVIKRNAPKLIGSMEVIRIVDRGSGHIYEAASSTYGVTKLSNTTYTKIYEAFFVDKGESVIYRDLIGGTDIIRTQYGKLSFESATATVAGLDLVELPQDISHLSVSPKKESIFTVSNTGPRAHISRVDGSSKVVAFNTPLKEWLTQWVNDKTILITTKPSVVADGFSYLYDTSKRSLNKIIGNIKGLTTLMSPDGKYLLYSESIEGSMRLYSYDVKNQVRQDLYLRTLPEKCVWSKKNPSFVYCAIPEDMEYSDYPDIWYQGVVSFSDNIWRINITTGETRLLIKPTDFDNIIDVINPTISSSDDYIVFQNKYDLSVWGLDLSKALNPVVKKEPSNSNNADDLIDQIPAEGFTPVTNPLLR